MILFIAFMSKEKINITKVLFYLPNTQFKEALDDFLLMQWPCAMVLLTEHECEALV